MNHPADRLNQNPAALAFLAQPLVARLATCNPATLQPHVVPVWYEWDGESLWVSTFRNSRKVRELRQNPRLSLVVDVAPSAETNQGVIFEGRAELIEDPALGIARGERIYARYLGEAGAQAEEPQSWLHDPQHVLIRLRPEWIYVWGL